MSWREDLLSKANQYCESTGRARSGLGMLIMKDPKFFDEIESGRSCTVDTLVRVNQWFAAHTPKKKSKSINNT